MFVFAGFYVIEFALADAQIYVLKMLLTWFIKSLGILIHICWSWVLFVQIMAAAHTSHEAAYVRGLLFDCSDLEPVP